MSCRPVNSRWLTHQTRARGAMVSLLIVAAAACTSSANSTRNAAAGSAGSGGGDMSSGGTGGLGSMADSAAGGEHARDSGVDATGDGFAGDNGVAGSGDVVDGAAGTGTADSSEPVDASAAARDAAPGEAGLSSCVPTPPETNSASLAGQWDFTPTGSAAAKIQVPGGGWLKQGFNTSAATYRTTVMIPNSGGPQTTLLEFGAVNHEATLTIGNTVVGTTMTSYTPSVFDITRYVTPGQPATVSVLVRGRDAFKNAAGNSTIPLGAGWSPNLPQGIFRSATLRVYPDVYVSDVFVRPSVSAQTLTYDVSVTNSGSSSRQVSLTGTLDSWNCDPLTYPRLPSNNVTVAAGATVKVTVGPIAWALGPSSYWWPNVPYQPTYQARLHNLRVSVGDASRTHTRAVRFGFRDSEQKRADAQHVYYYLNGVRVNFRGDNLQGADYDSINFGGGAGDAFDTFPGFLPPSATNPGWPQAVRNYQRLNYNVVRVHQIPASPYMLDVADELGLMLIDESAIRGTDNEDFVTGHDFMVNHVRALTLRDRNHASVIRWSMSNEENISSTDSTQFAADLYNGMNALDGTRPISADVSSDFQMYNNLTQPNFSAFGHYLGTGSGTYTDLVAPRTDRPFGQGELIWPKDVTPQGFMWFATTVMSMRGKDASDVRPYTLLSAWASFVPGVRTTMMRLEPIYAQNNQINPPMFGEDNLPDPWSNAIVNRNQVAFNPVLVADTAYWDLNKLSNANGDWPITKPTLPLNADVVRNLIVYNDTFSGTGVSVSWEVHAGSATGPVASMGTITVDVPLGFRTTAPVTIHTPASGTTCTLVLRAQKGGVTLFEDNAVAFTLN
jgi:hypothetical protein